VPLPSARYNYKVIAVFKLLRGSYLRIGT